MTPKQSVPSSPKIRRMLYVCLAVGTVCVLIATWLLLATTPGAQAEERAFKEAAVCPSSRDDTGDDGGNDTGDDGGDCLRTVTAVIDRTEGTGGKSPHYWLYITENDGTYTRTRLSGTPREHPVANPGARVEVTYWRGQIRYVDFESARRYTKADVQGAYRMPLAFALGLGTYGVAFAASALMGSWISRRSPRAYSWQVTLTLTGGICLALVGAAAPWPTRDIGGALRLLGLGALVILAGCAVVAPILWRRGRGDDTIAMEPSVPTGEKRIDGVILGDVPYASGANSISFLIAAPGSLVTALAPTGLAHRKETPSTLTPVRLRPPYLTDPPGRPDFRGRAVVLECEDGGVPVLIVTRKKDMPVVLGALRKTPATEGPQHRPPSRP
ncbi:hypothetical protein [Streptomyces sp. cmx-18-6]|uniref:hypothetical protein n=1 Tax=Streptomyces sp. cmx-18-6 TaxID=2790930 RepID=UPI003980FD60